MKSSDIYWGAVPWIGLQAIMVAIVIAFPIVVTALLDKPIDVDLSKVKIEVPQIDLPPLDFGQPKWSRPKCSGRHAPRKRGIAEVAIGRRVYGVLDRPPEPVIGRPFGRPGGGR